MEFMFQISTRKVSFYFFFNVFKSVHGTCKNFENKNKMTHPVFFFGTSVP